MGRIELWIVGALLGCAGAAPTSWAERWEPDATFRDAVHPAVLRIGRHCSGTLVAPDLVLTAAHCLDRPAPARDPAAIYPRELAPVIAEGVVHEVVGCRIHPEAYEGVTRCRDRPDRPVERAHDLALLRLDGPVAGEPLPVAVEPYELPAQLLLVGWHRRPRRTGPMRRYAGRTTVVGIEGSTLVVEATGADESESFNTHGGNSGGPALDRVGGVATVVGVLSKHTLQAPRRSFFAATTAPTNARWLERAMAELGE